MTETTQHEADIATASGDERGVWRAVVRGASTVLLIAVVGLAGLLVVGPRLLGGESLTVLSGSMQPSYQVGDLLVVVPQHSYDIGDVVTFQPHSGDPMLITHRIIQMAVGSEGLSYTTRGDANGTDDEPIVAAQIKGEVVAHVPYVGHVSLALGQHRNTVLTVLGLALIGYCISTFVPGRKAK